MSNNKNDLKIAFTTRVLAGVIAIICLLIPLCPAITMSSGDVKKTYGPCYSFIFGGMINSTNISYSSKGFSGLALAGFIIISIALLLLIMSFCIQDKTIKRPVLTFVSAISFIAGAIIFASLHKSVSNVLADSLINGHSDAVSKTVFNNSNMEFGSWGVSLFGFISSFLLLSSLLFDGTFNKIRSRIGSF